MIKSPCWDMVVCAGRIRVAGQDGILMRIWIRRRLIGWWIRLLHMVLIISTHLLLIVWGVPSVPRVLPLNVIRATRILLLPSCLISLLPRGHVRLLSRCTATRLKNCRWITSTICYCTGLGWETGWQNTRPVT